MPGDEHLTVIRHEAQLFDAAHTGFGRMGETPIREIQKAALKDSQADDCQRIDCHEKGQRPFQPIFPLSPKSSLAGGLIRFFGQTALHQAHSDLRNMLCAIH